MRSLMRKFNLSVCAAAALSIVSCTEINLTEQPVADAKSIIRASLVETKTTVADNGAYSWTSGDEVSVFDEQGVQCPSSFVAQSAGSSVIFEGQKEDVTDVLKYALYPYDAAATCTTAGVISTSIPSTQDGNISSALSVAVSSDGVAFPFVNASSVIKVSFDSSDDIRYMRMDFAAPVTGDVTVDCATGEIAGASCNSVILSSEEALSGAKYLSIAPVAKGDVKFTFRNGQGLTAVKEATISSDFLAGHIRSLGAVRNLTFEESAPTLRDFAESFVTALDVWEANVGRVDADSYHNGEKTGWADVHFIPIGAPSGNTYGTSGNQYSPSLEVWKVVVGDQEYTSAQAWEIAIRGLMNLVTSEGEAFLDTMTSRNKAYTLANNQSFASAPMPAASSNCRWNSTPWYEGNSAVTYNGAAIDEVDINFLIKCGSWHIVRGLITNSGNPSPLGAIGNYQEFGTDKSSQLVLSGYSGLISPMRELLIAARIYKYLLDNSIDEDVYDAIKDRGFDFSLYGVDIDPLSLSTSFVDFPGEGASDQTVSFVARDLWTVSTDADWITLKTTSGGAKASASVKFDVDANSGPARQGTITISSGSQDVSFTVRQAKTSATKFYIKDFAKEYVKLIGVWEKTWDDVKLHKDAEGYKYGVHVIPDDTTITLGETTYDLADIFEIALRSYLLLDGYDGNVASSSVKGAGAFNSYKLSGSTMSGTEVPFTHSYSAPDQWYCETVGNGGYLNGTSGASSVKKSFLYNYACRNANYPLSNDYVISRIGTYSSGQVSGVTGSCSFQRALLTFAYFFKYMLDNNLEDATGISAEQTFTSTLFGPDVYQLNARANNYVWVREDYMADFPFGELATKGYGTIFLHEFAVDKSASDVSAFIAKAHTFGIEVHMWMIAFYDNDHWLHPIEDEEYNYDMFHSVLDRAKSYIDLGADGIHFDYLRFPGVEYNKASLHNYDGGRVTGTGAITEFCRMAKSELKAKSRDVVLSAALMPEINSDPYYGQVPSEMGQYLDVLVPMIYRYSNDSGTDLGSKYAYNTAFWFYLRRGRAKVWPTITTYKGYSSITMMTADELLAEVKVFNLSGTSGIGMFRFPYGELPDLSNYWR